MNKVNSSEKRKHPLPIRIPWGPVIGFLGVAFGAAVWALQTIQPTPEEDPNWVSLAQVEALEAKLEKREQDLARAQQQHKQARDRLSMVQKSQAQMAARLKNTIPLDELPAVVRGANAQSTVAKIQRLLQDQQSGGQENVNALLQVLGHLLESGTIDTKSPANNAGTQTLYRAVQTVLRSIGTYQGQVTGKQTDTYQALTQFQRSRKLKVDGKMGMKTFEAIAKQFQTSLRPSAKRGG